MVFGLSVAALLVGPAMAFASERWLRTSFANEVIIERQRQLIRRYAPSSVVSHIEQGDTGVDAPQRRKVTIFFSDVVGFTSMADRVDPEALAHIVNDYLGALADVIERHGGTLNEFAGDGVMAIFGAPDPMDPQDQVRAALAAAQDLQRSLPEWSKGWYQHGIVEDARARIGINTGTVSVGTFGSAVRATYTGIGLQTNIAARVQAQAEPGGILLSNTSWHLVKDQVTCEPRGQVMVKGVHFPIELYAPTASRAAGSPG
jgi:class 3 adenylate cyclase